LIESPRLFFVITGLDPVIQICGVPIAMNLDCRVKPGNDG